MHGTQQDKFYNTWSNQTLSVSKWTSYKGNITRKMKSQSNWPKTHTFRFRGKSHWNSYSIDLKAWEKEILKTFHGVKSDVKKTKVEICMWDENPFWVWWITDHNAEWNEWMQWQRKKNSPAFNKDIESKERDRERERETLTLDTIRTSDIHCAYKN